MAGTGRTPGSSGTDAPAPRRGTFWWAGHEENLPAGLDWLSARERARVDALRFTKRRTEHLLRRWVGKRTVAAVTGRPTDLGSLARIEVLNRATGAPYVSIDGAETRWEISLSDRAGCAVAVIGDAGGNPVLPLGVDVEIVEPRSHGFVTDFLTPAEQEWVNRRPPAQGLSRDAAANLVWSAKEAVLKVLQLGLREDTREVAITVAHEVRPDGWSRFTGTWREETVLEGWWRQDGSFLLTVAAHELPEPPVMLPGAVDVSRAVPVHSWMARPMVPPDEEDRDSAGGPRHPPFQRVDDVGPQ